MSIGKPMATTGAQIWVINHCRFEFVEAKSKFAWQRRHFCWKKPLKLYQKSVYKYIYIHVVYRFLMFFVCIKTRDPWYSAHRVSVCSSGAKDQCRECHHHQSSTSMVCRWYQVSTCLNTFLALCYVFLANHWAPLVCFFRNFVTLHLKLFHDTM